MKILNVTIPAQIVIGETSEFSKTQERTVATLRTADKHTNIRHEAVITAKGEDPVPEICKVFFNAGILVSDPTEESPAESKKKKK